MRGAVLLLGMLFYTPISIISPAAGLIAWEWFSLMSPHRLVYGIAYGLRLNGVIAVATLIGWMLSRERKRLTPDALPWVFVIFIFWITFNQIFVPFPDYVWGYWNRFIRIFIEVLLAFALLNNRARIHAMIWALVISVGFYGVRGGMFTLVTGGHFHVLGPPDTILADNNQLALTEVIMIPLLFYLSRQTQSRLIRIGILAAIGFQSIAVFGSYSRGGMIAFSVMAFMFWLRSKNKNKLPYAVFGIIVVAGGLSLMPAAFWERMNTLHDVNASASFDGRVQAWHVAYWYASEHFPFGAGFYAPQIPAIFHRYYPDYIVAHAAHSIYFQVLGEQGYPGLMLYLIMLLLGLLNARKVIRQTRNRPGFEWANDLGRMIFVSLIAFYVGASALSMAYFDAFLILLALTSTLRELTAPERVAAASSRSVQSSSSFSPSDARLAGAGSAVRRIHRRQPDPG